LTNDLPTIMTNTITPPVVYHGKPFRPSGVIY
jgi:hypothetical protein